MSPAGQRLKGSRGAGMHLISDEIYGNSIFPHKVKDFKSVAQVPPVNLSCCDTFSVQ
jgi:aspartate/methionine/tyrosine aminotransferase